jgi:hypothetical protein
MIKSQFNINSVSHLYVPASPSPFSAEYVHRTVRHVSGETALSGMADKVLVVQVGGGQERFGIEASGGGGNPEPGSDGVEGNAPAVVAVGK